MGSLFKSIARIAAPVAGFALGGPLGAGLASGATTLATGGNFGDALKAGGLSGITAGIGSGGLGSGVFGKVGTGINWTSAAPGYSTGLEYVGGNGLLGAIGRAAPGATSAAQGLGSAVSSGLKSTFGSLLPDASTTAEAANAGRNAASGFLNLGGNLYSAVQGSEAYKDMAKAQNAGLNRAIDLAQPYLAAGTSANARLSGLLGLGGENSDDILETLRNSPGYQFRMQQGQDALDKSLSARGMVFSGRGLKEAQELGQGLADQTYNDYVNQLLQQQSLGYNAAGNIGDMYQTQGDISANRIMGQNNTWNSALSGILDNNYGFGRQVIGYDPNTGRPIYG
jgi:hypothetical protein